MSPKLILTRTIVTQFANSLSGLVATRRRIITTILIVILLVSIVLVACGGGDKTPTIAPTLAPTPTPTLPPAAKYTYDNAGRLTQVDYPNGAKIIYTYDKAGNLISQETKK